jgi:hypothetical protein
VLRIIFEPKRDDVTGGCRNLHNVELNDLYYLPNIVRVIKYRRMTGGKCSTYGGGKRRVQGFGGKT